MYVCVENVEEMLYWSFFFVNFLHLEYEVVSACWYIMKIGIDMNLKIAYYYYTYC